MLVKLLPLLASIVSSAALILFALHRIAVFERHFRWMKRRGYLAESVAETDLHQEIVLALLFDVKAGPDRRRLSRLICGFRIACAANLVLFAFAMWYVRQL